MSDKRGFTPPPGQMPPWRGGGGPKVKPKNMKGTVRRLWGTVRGERRGILGILLLSALASAVAILSPYLTGRVVTAISRGEAIGVVLMALLAIYVSDWLIRFLQQFFMASIGQRMIHAIRVALFDKLTALSLSFFDRHRHGELMSRLTNDVDNISNTISNSLTMLLTYGFTIIGILCAMICLSPALTLVSLAGVGLILLLTKIVTKHTRKLFASQQSKLGGLNGQVEESVSGLMIVKAFCHEQAMLDEFEQKNEALCDASIQALIWSGYLMPLMNVINNLCFVAIAVLSGVLYIQGRIATIGLITSFLLYMRQFTRPFVEITGIYNNFQTAVAGAERVFEIMDEAEEPEDAPQARRLDEIKGDIEFINVHFGYAPEREVLRGIDLSIPAGTQVAVVGETGSGKTTLINLLTRFYDVTDGSILLDGCDLRNYRLADLRDAFGVVLQDTALFASTVRDNIRYGSPNATDGQVREAARAAGAGGFIERLPEGYDTVLEQGGLELSQGERQLLTIARAVLTHAPIMILDEATSSVDTVTEQRIRRAMLEICRGRTSFIIAHRLSTIRDSDLIVLIENGRIAEQGTHEELLVLNGKYASMFRTQSGGR